MADDKLSSLRINNATKQIVKVEFKETVDTKIIQQLAGVHSVFAFHDSLLNIQCIDAEIVKKQILQLSIDQNLNIVSLQTDSQSLEDVFKALTH